MDDRLFIPTSEEAGTRIDIFLAERAEITRSAIQKLIERGAVTVNGQPAVKRCPVKPGDVILLVLPDPEPSAALPQDIPLDVVYEDDFLIVVNKPRGMVVHPAAGNPDGTLVNALLFQCKGSLSGINGVVRPGIVHRIDRDTSGLIVAAKTDAAHLSLAGQLAAHHMERIYEAVACGKLREDSGTVNAPIGRHPVDRKRMAVVPDGKPAVTHYEVAERFQTRSLGSFTRVSCRLETGRTHQIRVHLASLGHRLLGDALYSGGKTNAFEDKYPALTAGQCLHARTLAFEHPATGETLRFTSELPEYFTSILDILKRNS